MSIMQRILNILSEDSQDKIILALSSCPTFPNSRTASTAGDLKTDLKNSSCLTKCVHAGEMLFLNRSIIPELKNSDAQANDKNMQNQ